MRSLVRGIRWDVTLQARNGFYWASLFLVMLVGSLVLGLPPAVREQAALWVPAILVMNLQITTFFFVSGLLLLERDEGTLFALAVSPLSPSRYLTTRIISLGALGCIETLAVVVIGFGTSGSWLPILGGIIALSVVYTAFGAAIAARYDSVNALLLPASAFVSLLLLPLLPHFGLAPRIVFLWHPIEPALVLLRAGYDPVAASEIAYGVVGSAFWCTAAFMWARRRVTTLMHDTKATGGR